MTGHIYNQNQSFPHRNPLKIGDSLIKTVTFMPKAMSTIFVISPPSPLGQRAHPESVDREDPRRSSQPGGQ